jgi:hypothetical protein
MNSEQDLIDAFGKVVADLEVFAIPALRSLARADNSRCSGRPGTDGQTDELRPKRSLAIELRNK